MADATVSVRLRSTPTRFGGRASIVGFIPDSSFVVRQLTAEQFEEIQRNRDIFSELDLAPESLSATEKAIRDMGELLSAERTAHAATKEALEKATADKQAAELAHGRTKGELEAMKKLAQSKR